MKITIVGGGGRVGSTAAFSLLINNLVEEAVLIDIQEDRAEGEALDISHSLSGMGVEGSVYGGSDYSLTTDSDLILITAGMARKPGMSRLELAEGNINIVKEVVEQSMEYSSNPFLFIVSNPVDVLTACSQKVSGLEHSRVFGLGTLLDTIRLKSILNQRLGVSYSEEVMVVGEHGDSMTPVFSKLNEDYPRKDLWEVFREVREGASKVIEAKGATWFAPAVAISRVVEKLQDKEGQVLPLSTYLEEHGVYVGYPARVSSHGVNPLDYSLSAREEESFLESVGVIKEALRC